MENQIIVKDNFNNYYRRNRRFIAKSKNDEFNASELLFEENVFGKNLAQNSLKEMTIVSPADQSMNDNQNYCNVNET